MKDNNILDKLAVLLPKIAFGSLFIAVIYILLACKNDITQFVPTSPVISHETVQIDGVGAVKTPYYQKIEKNKDYVIRDTVPEDVPDDYQILVYSNYSSVRIYIDGENVSSYGLKKPMMGCNMLGNIRVMAPVSKDMAGKNVVVVIRPYYDQNADLHSPVYGTFDALKMSVLGSNMIRIVIVVIMFTMCILAGWLIIYALVKKSNLNIKILIYYVFLLILSGVWIICSSDIPQFFTSANTLVAFLSLISLSMMAVAFNGFCEQIFADEAKVFEVLKVLGWGLPLLNVLGFLLGLYDPMQILPITHLYFMFTAGISLVISVRNWKKSSEGRIVCVSVGLVIITSIIGIVIYYIAPTTGVAGLITGIGLLIFSFGLIAVIISRVAQIVETDNNISEFKEMAFEDILTGLSNRSCFEKFFDDIEDMEIEGKSVTLFMFDLNFLKRVNDEFGHKAGDQMLIGLAGCIDKTFSKYGTSYRLGGDEYAAIVIGHVDKLLSIIDEFKDSIRTYNEYNEHKISTALGYATRKFHRGDPDFYIKLFREADDAMYANKVRMHEEAGEEVRNIKKP